MLSTILKYIYHLFIFLGFLIAYPIGMGITTRYIVLFIAILTVILQRERFLKILNKIKKKKLKIAFSLLVFCSLIVFVSNIFLSIVFNENNDYILWWHFLYQFLYLFIFSVYCAIEYESMEEFAYSWLFFILIESLIIYIAFINDSFRLLLYSVSYIGDGRFNTSIEVGTRVMGFGIIGSDGALTMSTGIMILVLLKLKNKINDIYFVLFSIIIFSATMLVGRTGSLVEIVLILFYIVISQRVLFATIWGGLGIVAIALIISLLMQSVSLNVSDHMQEWMYELYDDEKREGVFEVAKGRGFQSNNHMLFGNGGLQNGSFEGVRYKSDSGYVRMYTAVGIVGSIFYYGAMLFFFLSHPNIRDRKMRLFSILLIIIVFMVEIKEPYLTKLRIPWFVYTILLLSSMEEYKKIPITNNCKSHHKLIIKGNSK